MSFPVYYIIPLCSAVVFAVASILIKKAILEGSGLMRNLIVSNWFLFLCVCPLWFLGEGVIAVGDLWVPVTVGFLAFIGATFVFVSLNAGDVSVATPLMGSKAVFVAFWSALLLTEPVPLSWWVGAIVAALAVFLLGYTNDTALLKGQLTAIGAVLFSSASFGLGDVLIQRFGDQYNLFRFVVVVSATQAIFSVLLLPLCKGRLRDIPPRSLGWLLGGTFLIATQFLLIIFFLTTWGKATAMNILYSSRGVWSILLVWMFRKQLKNIDFEVTHGMFLRRMGGALLLCLAVVIVLLNP